MPKPELTKEPQFGLSLNDIQIIDAFKDLSLETQKELLNICMLKTIAKDEVLFANHDVINGLYAIVSGKIQLLRYSANGQKRVFFILSEGALINEVVFDNLHVSIDCECFEDAKLLYIPKNELLSIMKKDFDLTLNILNSSGRKQRRLYRQLKNTVQTRMDRKLAAKLWKLAKDHGKKDESGVWTIISIDITVTYLSHLLGVPRETISRALKELIDNDLVCWFNKSLAVKEEEILEYYRTL